MQVLTTSTMNCQLAAVVILLYIGLSQSQTDTGCSTSEIMNCGQKFRNFINLADTFDENHLARSSQRVCGPLLEFSECVDKFINCSAFKTVVSSDMLQRLHDMERICDVSKFMQTHEYKQHQMCYNSSFTNAYKCISEYLHALPLGTDLNKIDHVCCPTQAKMFCFEKAFPKQCDSSQVTYEFIEDIRSYLKKNCAGTGCSHAGAIHSSWILSWVMSVVAIVVGLRFC